MTASAFMKILKVSFTWSLTAFRINGISIWIRILASTYMCTIEHSDFHQDPEISNGKFLNSILFCIICGTNPIGSHKSDRVPPKGCKVTTLCVDPDLSGQKVVDFADKYPEI